MDDTLKQVAEKLVEITEGKGRYNLDPLIHASNTIEDMKKLATEALDLLAAFGKKFGGASILKEVPAMTLAKLDELIDTVKGGKPDLLMMSRRSRRKFNALMPAVADRKETM